MALRGRPWMPNAESIAASLEFDNERDDEFGSIKELKKDARRETNAHGHALAKFSFKGAHRWVTMCNRCVKVLIVDDSGVNFFGHRDCPPCDGHVGSLNAVLGGPEIAPVPT